MNHNNFLHRTTLIGFKPTNTQKKMKTIISFILKAFIFFYQITNNITMKMEKEIKRKLCKK